MSQHLDIADYVYDPIRGFLPGDQAHTIKPNGLQGHFRKMNPFLRTLLVTDGTVTKFLEAYLWEPISVERLYQEEIILKDDIPACGLSRGESAVLRRILLKGALTKVVYAFAESFLRIHLLEESLQKDLRGGRLGIGELLRDRRLETYREILEFGEEKAGEELAAHFSIRAGHPICFRRYRISVKGRPAIMITEKFFEPHFDGRRGR